ncbi:phage protease [Rhizobiales bacterium 3FA27D7]|jgi:phage I-like protein|uniref:phage protease n=1 Tax=Mesorhizobium sp. 2RAF21 TaxID=3232995 RepID=UPI0010FA4D8A
MLRSSLHSTVIANVALCAAVGLPEGAPDWVHLLPAGEIRTCDGRGPYRVPDAARLATVSLGAGERLPIDENHATDLAAPQGRPAPARGWIVELQARADGVWGRVEWTEDGRHLVTSRAYRGISPAIQHAADGTVTAILRASLVNRPNLRGLTTLHQETEMNPLLEKLLAALGLPAATTEEAALTAVTTLHAEKAKSSTAMQAALDPIAVALGLQAGIDAGAVLTGVQALATGNGGKDSEQALTALQSELATVTKSLNSLQETTKREKAEAYVDGAIKAGRVGVKPLRDRYVAMHMADPAGTAELIAGLPVLGGGGEIVPPPVPAGEIALQAEQRQAARLLGIAEKDYLATLKAERQV